MHMIEQILNAIEINGYLISRLSISGIYFTSKSPAQMNQNPIAIAIRTTDNRFIEKFSVEMKIIMIKDPLKLILFPNLIACLPMIWEN